MSRSWSDIGEESRKAAEHCLKHSYFRAAANRAYFCAFQWVTFFLRETRTADLPTGRECWNHQSLPRILERSIKTRKRLVRTNVVKALKDLYMYRLIADYSAQYTLDGQAAKDALRKTLYVCERVRTMMRESGHDC
jgi:uncharacterized protein (UPF0332 family)